MVDNNEGQADTGKASAMLDAFASVGVNTFDLTITNIKEDERGRQIVVGYDENQSISELRRRMPYPISDATRKQNNNIVRPYNPPGVIVIQLDDLDAAKVACVVDHSFIVICTSKGKDGTGNYQAWVAVNDALAEERGREGFCPEASQGCRSRQDRERRDPHCRRLQFQTQIRARVSDYRDYTHEPRQTDELRLARPGRCRGSPRGTAPAPARLHAPHDAEAARPDPRRSGRAMHIAFSMRP